MEIAVEHKNGFKKTKLGWIPEDWKIITLNELGETITGLTYSPEMINKDGILVLRSSNVQDRGLKFEDNVYVNVENDKFNETEEGDILICVRNGSRDLIGKNAIVTKVASGTAFGAFMLVFRSKDYEYLYQLFDTDFYLREIHKNLGATINSINTNNFKKFKFPYPNLSERTLIANCLNTWDEAIQNLTTLIDKKELQKKGLKQQLLTGKTRLEEFSDDWKEYSFKNILKDVKRPVNWDDNELYKLISVRRRSGGLFHRDSLFGHKIKTKNLRTALKGDLLISKMQILHGASGLVTDEFDNMKISGSYLALRAKNEDILNMEYLNWYTKIPYFYHQCYISSYGVHIEKMTFNFKLFLKEKIKLPSVEEQAAILKVLNKAKQETDLLNKMLEQLKTQKKGLMQQLLTGKKRLKF